MYCSMKADLSSDCGRSSPEMRADTKLDTSVQTIIIFIIIIIIIKHCERGILL